ncbi:MAG: hypothetical protein DMF27_04840, partial [Verrucomicrobia bacterium]
NDKVAELKEEAWRVLGFIKGYLGYLRDCKADERSIVREGDDTLTVDDDDALALLDEALSDTAPL